MDSNLLSTRLTTQLLSQVQSTQDQNIFQDTVQQYDTDAQNYNDNLTLEQIRDRNKFELMILLTQVKKTQEKYAEELAIYKERANLQKAKFDLSKKAEVEEILSLNAEQIQNLFIQRIECVKAEINTKSEQKYHLNSKRNMHQVLDQSVVAQVNSLRRQIGQLSDQLKETMDKEKKLDDEKEEAQKQVALLKERQKSHALKVFAQVKQKMARSMSKYIMQSEGQAQKMTAPPGLPNPSSLTSRFQPHYANDSEIQMGPSALGPSPLQSSPSPAVKDNKTYTDIVRKSPLRYTRFAQITPVKTPGLPRLTISNLKTPSRLGNMSRFGLSTQSHTILNHPISEQSPLRQNKNSVAGDLPERATTSGIDNRNKEYQDLHKDCNKKIRKLKDEFNELVEQNNKFQHLLVDIRNKIQKILLRMNLKSKKQGFLEIMDLEDKQIDRFIDEFMEDGCIEVLLELCLLEDASYNIKPKKNTNQRVGLEAHSNALQRRYDIIYDV